MNISRRRALKIGTCTALAAAGMRAAHAQQLELSRIVVGFPAGSSVDALARALAKHMTGTYSKSVIVENKPGVAGQLGAVAVKAGPSDGSTLLLTPMTVLGVYPFTYRSLPYDPIADFVPVTNAVTYDLALAVGSAVPATVTSLPQLVEWLKTRPNMRSIGNPAVGSTLHFAAMLFAKSAGLELQHVPYVGGAMFNDLVGGTLPMCVSTLGSLLPLHKEGRLRILATSGEARSPSIPTVPNFVESGFPDLVFKEWIGVFLPAKTPPQIVAQLNQVLRAALATTETASVMAMGAQQATPSSPEELGALLRKDTELWRQRVRAIGFTATS